MSAFLHLEPPSPTAVNQTGAYPPRQSTGRSDSVAHSAVTIADAGSAVIMTTFRRSEQAMAGSVQSGVVSTDVVLTVVAASGEVDMDTVHVLHAALTGAIDAGGRVCCDLSRVRFFGAAGISAVLAAHRRAASVGQRFTVRGAHGITRRVLEATGVHEVLTLEG